MKKEKTIKITAFHFCLFLCIVLSFVYFDLYVFDLTQSLNSSVYPYFSFIRSLQDSEYSLAFCAFLLISAILCNKYAILTRASCFLLAKISLYIISAIALSGFITNIIKILMGRPRPNFYKQTDIFAFQWFELENSLRSFPSGHTSTGISIIMVFLCLTAKDPLWRFALFLLGIMFAISHMIVMAHWFSDVVMGGYIAILTVLFLQTYCDRFYDRLANKVIRSS